MAANRRDPSNASDRSAPIDPSPSDYLAELNAAAKEIAHYASRLIRAIRAEPIVRSDFRSDPSFLIDCLLKALSGHPFQPSDIEELSLATPQVPPFYGIHGTSYHDLAWNVGEWLLQSMADVGNGFYFGGLNLESKLTMASLVGLEYRVIAADLRARLSDIPNLNDSELSMLMDKELTRASDLVRRRQLEEKGASCAIEVTTKLELSLDAKQRPAGSRKPRRARTDRPSVKKKATPGRKLVNKALDLAVEQEWDTGHFKDRFDMAKRSKKLKPLLDKEKDPQGALRKSMHRIRRLRCALRRRRDLVINSALHL